MYLRLCRFYTSRFVLFHLSSKKLTPAGSKCYNLSCKNFIMWLWGVSSFEGANRFKGLTTLSISGSVNIDTCNGPHWSIPVQPTPTDSVRPNLKYRPSINADAAADADAQCGQGLMLTGEQYFNIPTAWECKMFKWIQLQQVGFVFPYHLWVSLSPNLHS